ncbi:MAG TPA: hypothetical protein DEO85_06540 [Maritimibacter sp.]|nr:hypothetical protein [Maritimibacter sp.]
MVHKAGCEPFPIAVRGRDRWALCQLIDAGERGCTPIDNPAPRWSAYVHDLRKMGLPIETIHERHTGAYPGTHGRYILKATVRPIGEAKP